MERLPALSVPGDFMLGRAAMWCPVVAILALVVGCRDGVDASLEASIQFDVSVFTDVVSVQSVQ